MIEPEHEDIIRQILASDLVKGTDKGFRTVDLENALGIGHRPAMRVLRKLIQAGHVVPCKVAIVDLSGRTTATTGWRWIEEGTEDGGSAEGDT